MTFKDIIGQERAINILRSSIRRNRLTHAYLFSGPEGVGKRITALALAKALNCVEHSDSACGICLSCHKINGSNHPDVKVIEPQGLSLSIAQMRELQKEISLKPFEGRWKVYIISEAEKMTPQAANSLLKTLEEPPPHSLIILVTSQEYSLLPTIISRCQRIKFDLIPEAMISQRLQELCKISAQQADIIAILSGGSLGKALQMEEKGFLEMREMIISSLSAAANSKPLQLLQLASRFSSELIQKEDNKGLQERVDDIFDVIGSWYRDLLFLKLDPSRDDSSLRDILINADKEVILRSQLRNYSLPRLLELIAYFDEIKSALVNKVNIQLVWEVLFLKVGNALS